MVELGSDEDKIKIKMLALQTIMLSFQKENHLIMIQTPLKFVIGSIVSYTHVYDILTLLKAYQNCARSFNEVLIL